MHVSRSGIVKVVLIDLKNLGAGGTVAFRKKTNYTINRQLLQAVFKKKKNNIQSFLIVVSATTNL